MANSAIICALVCVTLFFLVNPVTAAPPEEFPYVIKLQINNYLLFTLSKQSEILNADTPISTFLEQVLIENAVDIQKVHLAPLIKRVRFKIRHLRDKLRRCKGGRAYARTLDKWKTTSYELNVPHKTGSPCKRKLEECVKREQQASKQARRELHETRKKLLKVEKRQQELQRNVDRLLKNKQRRGKNRNKRSYSRSHMRRQFKNNIQDLQQTISLSSFNPVSVTVENTNGQLVEIALNLSGSSQKTGITEDEVDKILYVIDKNNISSRAYRDLTHQCPTLPKEHVLKERKFELNRGCNVKEIDDCKGVWQSFRECIVNRLAHPDPSIENVLLNDTIHIKLSGDGTKFGKRMHIVNITFNIIGEDVSGADGQYLLAVLKVPEKYEHLKDALPELVSEIRDTKSVVVAEKEYALTFYLGGDLKFLNQVMGIDSFGCKYPCLWCKCPSELRWDTTQKWSMINPVEGARTNAEIVAMAAGSKKHAYNCSHPPLFENVEVACVVPDTLHLFLRIADQLMSQLIAYLRQLDNTDKVCTKFSGDRCKNMVKFEEFVQSLKIEWNFFIDREQKKISSRDFTGPEYVKIFSQIDLDSLIPQHPKLGLIKTLWRDFQCINEQLTKNLSPDDIDHFEVFCRSWVKTYTEVYQRKDITPYMHVLMNHIPEALKIHGCIAKFSQQSLEKLNDITTCWFFRSTNHRGTSALKQIMLKQHRMRLLRTKCQRQSVASRCSRCKQRGHNKRTCLQAQEP